VEWLIRSGRRSRNPRKGLRGTRPHPGRQTRRRKALSRAGLAAILVLLALTIVAPAARMPVLPGFLGPALAQTKEPPPPPPDEPKPPPDDGGGDQDGGGGSGGDGGAAQPSPTPAADTPVPPTTAPPPTNTPRPRPTSTPTPTATPTPAPTNTPTKTPTHTPSSTPPPTATATPSPIRTPTATSTPSPPALAGIEPLAFLGRIPWPLLGLATILVLGAGATPLVLRRRRRARPPAASPFTPGLPKTVGRYEIRERLGSGGAAVVYSAWDPRLRREVNVKVLHTHLLGTEAEKRMRREARALANLQHGVIQAIVEIIDMPGQLALVVESVDAMPLDRYLAERGRLPLTEALAIVRALAGGLDHAHQRGVVHRDVKPGNILVGRDGRHYLVDFGLAAYYEAASLLALTHQGDLLGTPAYMSPEQIRGETADHRSDVYSLGVVLYEMLTGRRPFDGDTPTATLMRQLNDEPPERPLEELPESIRSVVKRALQKSPGRRYQSAGALADALKEAVASEQRHREITVHADELTVVHHVQDLATARASARELARLRVVGEEGTVEPVLEIYALGQARVVREGHTVSRWRMADARELFFYLLLQGPRRRDEIGVDFWPDLDADTVANRHNVALSRLRSAVGTDAVVIEGGQCSLGDVDYWFDVREFDAWVRRARDVSFEDEEALDLWQRAVELYGGDLLPDVGRDWCVTRREELRQMYVEALVGVGRCHEARREFNEAISWYRRALDADELREDVHRRIMQCYVEGGRRAEAVEQYHRCESTLARELGLDPAPETRELYERIAT
jgi:two-component SAPR family response regulator